mgnify:CR=1
MKELTGKYKHYCPDWDYLELDETCQEFVFCLCFSSIPEVSEFKHGLEIDTPW